MDTSQQFNFIESLALSKSIQGVVRSLELFNKKYQGATLIFKSFSEKEGVAIDFGTNDNKASQEGLNDFIGFLQKTEELMLLQNMIEHLKDRGADPLLINQMVGEAEVIIQELYPQLKKQDQ